MIDQNFSLRAAFAIHVEIIPVGPCFRKVELHLSLDLDRFLIPYPSG